MEGLAFLLKAPSQKAVEDLFLLSFTNRHAKITPDERRGAAELLQITEAESQRVRKFACEVLV